MSPIQLDFSQVEDRKPVPEGVYLLTVETAEEKPSKTSSNVMIAVKFAVEGYPANKIFENYVITPKALWKLKEFMNALGYETSEISEVDPAEFIGQQVMAKVVLEAYEGTMVNRIKSIFAA